MKLEILSKRDKEKISELLKDAYGLGLPRCHIIQSSKERLRIFTGDLSERELLILANTIRLETIGLYFAFIKNENEKGSEFRLSFDSSLVFKDATKNILELDEGQMKLWISGHDLDIDSDKIELVYPFVLLRYKEEIIGCGKLTQNKVLNFVPKERRIKHF